MQTICFVPRSAVLSRKTVICAFLSMVGLRLTSVIGTYVHRRRSPFAGISALIHLGRYGEGQGKKGLSLLEGDDGDEIG